MKDLQKHIHILVALLLIVIPSAVQAQNTKATGLSLDTICLDPGHGGKDPGCVSKDGTYEKDIVLAIGLKVRDMLKKEVPQMKVLMTRSDDRFIELAKRADIANRNGAKLFISIHVNAVDPKLNRNYASVSGFSVHTLGQSRTASNMEMVKRENAVILLEDDHDAKYEGFNPNDPESYIIFNLMQSSNLGQSLEFASAVLKNLDKGPLAKDRGISQDPYLVLWKTTMPAVLLECGFITNQGDLSKIRTAAGQEEIARRIVDAIVEYKGEYEGVSVKKAEAKPEAKKEVKAETAVTAGEQYYGIQILASAKLMKETDPFFKGNPNTKVKVGTLYKYIACPSSSLEDVKKSYAGIKDKFPGCFIVMVEGEKIERVR